MKSLYSLPFFRNKVLALNPRFICFQESGPSYRDYEQAESASEQAEAPEPTQSDRVEEGIRRAEFSADISDRLLQQVPDVGEELKGEVASCRKRLGQIETRADYLSHCTQLAQASREFGPTSEAEILRWDPNPQMPEDLDMTQEQWDELHIEEKEYIINGGMDVLIDPIDIIATGGVVTLAKVGGKLSFAVVIEGGKVFLKETL